MSVVDYVTIDSIVDTLVQEPQVDLQERHTFIEGIYVREVTMPAGSLIIGHVHKKEMVNIMASGIILLKYNMEDDWEELVAPYTVVSQPGSRKIIYVIEDCTFMNVIRTDNTDLDVLYEECVEPDYRTSLGREMKELTKDKIMNDQYIENTKPLSVDGELLSRG